MKVWNYMIIMLTLMIFLAFMGFTVNGADALLGTMGIEINTATGALDSGDVGNSDWFSLLFSATGLIVLAGLSTAVIVGLFTRQFEWKLVILAFFTSFVTLFISVGWSIIQLAQTTGETWLIAIIATIFLPLTVMFIFSIVEWFGGAGG